MYTIWNQLFKWAKRDRFAFLSPVVLTIAFALLYRPMKITSETQINGVLLPILDFFVGKFSTTTLGLNLYILGLAILIVLFINGTYCLPKLEKQRIASLLKKLLTVVRSFFAFLIGCFISILIAAYTVDFFPEINVYQTTEAAALTLIIGFATWAYGFQFANWTSRL